MANALLKHCPDLSALSAEALRNELETVSDIGRMLHEERATMTPVEFERDIAEVRGALAALKDELATRDDIRGN